MVIRSAMTFSKRPVQNIIINQKVVVQPQKCHHHCGGGGLSFLTGIFTGLLNNCTFGYNNQQTVATATVPIQQPQAPAADTSKQLENLQKLATGFSIIDNQDGTFTAYDENGKSKTGPYADVRDYLLDQKNKPSEKAQTQAAVVAGIKQEGQGGPKATYRIEENPNATETVNTIKYGGPWHYAQYYTDANGKELTKGSADFNAIMNKLKTEMGEVEGDRSKRVLPKQITVGNKTFSLMGAEKRAKLDLEGQKGNTDTRYNIKSNVSTYSVYEINNNTETLIGSNLTKENAEKLKTEKENAQ